MRRQFFSLFKHSRLVTFKQTNKQVIFFLYFFKWRDEGNSLYLASVILFSKIRRWAWNLNDGKENENVKSEDVRSFFLFPSSNKVAEVSKMKEKNPHFLELETKCFTSLFGSNFLNFFLRCHPRRNNKGIWSIIYIVIVFFASQKWCLDFYNRMNYVS